MIYCARHFSAQDIQSIKDLMAQNPQLKRAALSRKLCELFAWNKPNGEMKDMTCRVALLRMQADGLITLPPSQMRSAKGRPHFPPTPATEPQAPVLQPVHELGALTLRRVSAIAPSRLWNEYIARYHYLGYTPMSVFHSAERHPRPMKRGSNIECGVRHRGRFVLGASNPYVSWTGGPTSTPSCRLGSLTLEHAFQNPMTRAAR